MEMYIDSMTPFIEIVKCTINIQIGYGDMHL